MDEQDLESFRTSIIVIKLREGNSRWCTLVHTKLVKAIELAVVVLPYGEPTAQASTSLVVVRLQASEKPAIGVQFVAVDDSNATCGADVDAKINVRAISDLCWRIDQYVARIAG